MQRIVVILICKINVEKSFVISVKRRNNVNPRSQEKSLTRNVLR